ncbi:hypothetical protein PSH49_21830 [Pseudoalteromonas sp. GABNS16G]|uniref:hypothetical protein n=1 Tax=Pseudoalteromonas sp. GABNS16G TaxID=3025324 RepID=UPI002359EB8D|nr:hypothetical protein [Pseudoalteromonas sp. GABNS16G]MDC9603218.1 hypothetical protein [Pseudoalteromonas sp. GABNS16G]
MTELSEPMIRLAELNQFVPAELNPENFKGPKHQGLLNVLNGCFVRPVTITEQQGVFRTKTAMDDDAVYLVWLEDSYDNNAHAVRLSGDSLAKFERAMKAQSKTLD